MHKEDEANERGQQDGARQHRKIVHESRQTGALALLLCRAPHDRTWPESGLILNGCRVLLADTRGLPRC